MQLRAIPVVLVAPLICGCGADRAERIPDGDGNDHGSYTVDDVLAAVATCRQVSDGTYATDGETGPSVSICGLDGAVFWQADMDIDCDGKVTEACNERTDPAYQNETSLRTSTGDWLDAATLPYVVVPLPSPRFDYERAGIRLGAVAAVIYERKLRFGIFGDEGPDDIIGEASYRMAMELGINPDPANGGTDTGVTYIVFVGADAVVDPVESNPEAVRRGDQLMERLLQNK